MIVGGLNHERTCEATLTSTVLRAPYFPDCLAADAGEVPELVFHNMAPAPTPATVSTVLLIFLTVLSLRLEEMRGEIIGSRKHKRDSLPR